MTDSPATVTRKQKSRIMTRFLLDYEILTGQRVTIELINSPEWREMRKRYVDIFLPLMQEKGTQK